jgi:hypothetical protein
MPEIAPHRIVNGMTIVTAMDSHKKIDITWLPYSIHTNRRSLLTGQTTSLLPLLFHVQHVVQFFNFIYSSTNLPFRTARSHATI